MANRLDRFFDDLTGRPITWSTPFGPGAVDDDDEELFGGDWSPQLEVFRRGDQIVMRAHLPGLDRDEIEVEVEDDVLTISGERTAQVTDDQEHYYREVRYGSFSRSIALPEGTDPETCSARFHDGVLEIVFKAPPIPEGRGRRITID